MEGSLQSFKTSLNKSPGVLIASLQTHQSIPQECGNFLPEYFITNFNENIPGLSFNNSIASLCDTFTGIIDNISISYGEIDSTNIEAIILDHLRRDLCYKQNKSPLSADIPKLQILERRLRVC